MNHKIKFRDLDPDVISNLAAILSGGTVVAYNDTAIKNDINYLKNEIMNLQSINHFDKSTDKITMFMLETSLQNIINQLSVKNSSKIKESDFDTILSNSYNNLKTDVSDNKSNISAITTNISNINNDIITLTSLSSSCSTDVAAIQATVATVNSSIPVLQSDIDNLKNDNTSINIDVNTLKSQVASITSDLINVKTQIDPSMAGGFEQYTINAGDCLKFNFNLDQKMSLMIMTLDEDLASPTQGLYILDSSLYKFIYDDANEIGYIYNISPDDHTIYIPVDNSDILP